MGVPMRDLVADWKKWSRAERVLAVMGTLRWSDEVTLDEAEKIMI